MIEVFSRIRFMLAVPFLAVAFIFYSIATCLCGPQLGEIIKKLADVNEDDAKINGGGGGGGWENPPGCDSPDPRVVKI